MAKQEWQATRGRILGRRDAFIASRGSCEQCENTEGLMVAWRDHDDRDRPVRSMWHLWNRSEKSREPWGELLIVLCPDHLRVHKSGVTHGGGAKGVRGCKCGPCRTRYREYFRGKMREIRERDRGQRVERDADGPSEQDAGPSDPARGVSGRQEL